ncbi:MAG: ABC transporter substrate-binding protein [Candidatus Aminicenantes bacterium]|nr:ABC transporter substrate-binding protein [Candidatus Aminicenantes bacterium]
MKFLKKISILFFLLVTVSILPNGALGEKVANSEENPVIGGTYRIPLEFNPKTLDPALSIDAYAVTTIQQLFDGLVQFDNNLNIIPAIAKSWKISHDGLTYTFYLRKGVRFHNGREVTSKDFVYSFTRILNPDTKSSCSDFFTKILGAKEFVDKKTKEVRGLMPLDSHTLKIILSESYAPFISILAMKGAKVIPGEEVEKSEVDFGKSLIGTGPFKFVSMKDGKEIILEANPDYFEGRPYLDKIIFKIFHGSPREEIFRRFKDGEFENSPIPFEAVEQISKSKKYKFLQKPILSLRFYGLNTQIEPLKIQKVRKAINFAIPKETIGKDILKGMALLTNRIIPLGMPGYTPNKVGFGYQPQKLIELLRESGYPDGRGLPSIEFWSAANSELAVKELEMVKSYLSQIGITVNLQYETNWPKFQERLTLKKAPMFMYAWYADFPDPDNFLGTLFHSKSKYNYTSYHNPEVDRLLDKARIERDYLKRMEMYRKIEEIVLEDAPIVPMVNHLFQQAYQPYVRGVEVNALGGPYIPMKKIWLKK